MSPTSPRVQPFEGLALGFLLSGSGIFTCASPATASVKLSGYRETGCPTLPAGLGTLSRFLGCLVVFMASV
jgi:hypothetical protein